MIPLRKNRSVSPTIVVILIGGEMVDRGTHTDHLSCNPDDLANCRFSQTSHEKKNLRSVSESFCYSRISRTPGKSRVGGRLPYWANKLEETLGVGASIFAGIFWMSISISPGISATDVGEGRANLTKSVETSGPRGVG